jgi:hypothetical protein
MEVKIGTYLHYKGSEAQVIGVAKHTETKEEYVVYWHIESQTGKNQLWIRPKTMFLEKVLVDGKETPRFKYIGD